MTQLRNEMRKAGVDYIVIKNHIVGRACDAAGIDASIHEVLHGPSAFAFGYEDAVMPAKILKEFIKKVKKCEIKGGIIEGAVTSAKDLDAIADLPSRGRAHRPPAWQHDVADFRPGDRARSDRQEAGRRRRGSFRSACC